MTAERPTLSGIHHLKIPVSDLDQSMLFYGRALGAQRIPEADHLRPDGSLFAVIMRVEGLGTLLELRLHPVRAVLQRGFDPVTLLVETREELRRWDDHLTAARLEHSEILAGLQAWILVVPDPDGTRLRLYTKERHGPEVAADTGADWLDESVRLS